jgi:hypothetical protein
MLQRKPYIASTHPPTHHPHRTVPTIPFSRSPQPPSSVLGPRYCLHSRSSDRLASNHAVSSRLSVFLRHCNPNGRRNIMDKLRTSKLVISPALADSGRLTKKHGSVFLEKQGYGIARFIGGFVSEGCSWWRKPSTTHADAIARPAYLDTMAG